MASVVALTNLIDAVKVGSISPCTLATAQKVSSQAAAGNVSAEKKKESKPSAMEKKDKAESAPVDAPAVDPEVERRFALVKSVGEECVTETELRSLLKKPTFILYDGFEPSGRMHIAQGVFKVGAHPSFPNLLTVSCAHAVRLHAAAYRR